MTQRTRRSPQQWQTIVDRQASSDLSARAFCDAHQFSYPVFCKWRKRLASTDQAPMINLSTLANAVDAPQVAQWDIELDLGQGMALRLRRS
ncbi:MAG TPA: IS66 family insertion sequence element accessory protein TnpB [Dehalococcoidia bacterium]|nr:IS66 family insertion sequence element accessory protein TnpB [Dehalococcoidia bacterium]